MYSSLLLDMHILFVPRKSGDKSILYFRITISGERSTNISTQKIVFGRSDMWNSKKQLFVNNRLYNEEILRIKHQLQSIFLSLEKPTAKQIMDIYQGKSSVEKEKEKESKKKTCKKKKNYDHEIDKFLPEDKMILLENTPFEGRLQMYADIFIILQRTGINFTDYDQMDWKKAIKKMGEKEILELYRSKSGQKAIIPVLPSLKKILEKYNYQPPKRSPSMLNLQLKKIAELIGFDMPLSLKFGRKTITNLFLEKGVSIEVTAKVLGHKDLTMVQKHYAQIKHNRVLMEIIDKSL